MAAMRCSVCARNYPLNRSLCPVCGERLWHSNSSDPDEVDALPAGEEDDAPAIGAQRGDTVGWRAMQYERMGFTYPQAVALANTRAADGFYVDWHVVERALRGHDDDATRALVFDCYTLNA